MTLVPLRLRRPLQTLAALLLAMVAGFAQDFKKQVIYEIVTDRFFDGDTTNNNPPQSSGLFDPTKTNFHLYFGGDLAGIQQKMSYLKGLGITAIWISPPVDNLNLNIPDSSGNPTSTYHGYAARDFKRIEEHFGDVNNTFAAFDNMVAAAHANGIKVIVDFAPNHSNPNNAGEFGSLFDNGTFVAAFNNDPNGVFHHNADISDFNDRYQLQYFTLFRSQRRRVRIAVRQRNIRGGVQQRSQWRISPQRRHLRLQRPLPASVFHPFPIATPESSDRCSTTEHSWRRSTTIPMAYFTTTPTSPTSTTATSFSISPFSDRNAGEFGSLFDNGTFVAAFNNDPNGVFHHNADISDFNDRYQLQYFTLF